MTDLTTEQRLELQSNNPQFRDPVTGAMYVLIPADTYQHLQTLLDESVTATGELVDQVMAEDDANDPHLEEYQR